MLEWACSCVPPPPSERRPSQHGQQVYLQAGRAGDKDSTVPGGRAGLRGRGYVQREVRLHTTHTFYKAAFWVFVLFVYAKTIILNKCRL